MGVPVIAPVEVFSDKPDGRGPVPGRATAYVYGALPPLPTQLPPRYGTPMRGSGSVQVMLMVATVPLPQLTAPTVSAKKAPPTAT